MFHEEHMHSHGRRWKAMSSGKKVLVVAGWIVVIAGVLALLSFVAMLLWNRVMSGVLGLPALGFWDAVALFILAKLIFGGRPGAFVGRMRMRRLMRERMDAQAEEGEGKQA